LSDAINYLDRCARSARRTLDVIPGDGTRWSAAITLLTGDGIGRESVRLTRALGFAGRDATDLLHPRWHDEPIDAADLMRDLRERHPDGAGGLEVALLALGDLGPLSATAGRIRTVYGLNRDQVVRASLVVRTVSIASVRSAIVRASVDRQSESRTAGSSFDAGTGVIVPSSIGLHKLLGRADSLREQADRDTITSLDLLRASLPLWSDPTTEQLVVGIGLTVEIAAIAPSRATEPGTFHVRLDAGAEHEFDLSDAAFRSFLMASDIRDIEQQALTMTHLMLGMLLVPGSYLATRCRAALGDGVNLPLVLLRLGRNRVSQAAARLAADLGDRAGPGRVHAVADLPPRELRALALDLHDVEDPDFDAAARVAACAPAVGPSFAGTDEERREALTRFTGLGHFGSLRNYLLCDPPSAGGAAGRRLLAAVYNPSEASSLLDRLDAHRYTDGGIEPVVAPQDPDVGTRYAVTVSLLSAQDDHTGDIRAATHLAGSAVGEARAAARAGQPRLTAIWTAHLARVAARAQRVAQGVSTGRAGANLGLVPTDLDAAVGTVVSVLVADEHAIVARLGADGTAMVVQLASETIHNWWRDYRLACLNGRPTVDHLRHLARLTGLHAVLSGGRIERPLRLAVAGDFPGLPLGQAIASTLPDRSMPVVVHLAGGPFHESLTGSRAPGGLLQGSVAVIAPPPLVGAAGLPSAEVEAAGVARIHGARHVPGPDYLSRSSILRRMRLRSDALRPIVWHFATHGTMTVNAVGEVTAGVLLLDHEKLDADEIGRYAAPAVLLCSACDVGALPPQPGAISWPGAAIAAGSQTVVAACKPINDHIAAATMLLAHQRWADENGPLWSALNAAQVAVDPPGDAAVTAILEQFVADPAHRERIGAACATAGEHGDQWAFMTYAP
jgi:CHAT domain